MTEKQINEFNKSQTNKSFHPYTCDRKHKDCEVNIKPRDFNKDGVLIATKNGLICPCGNYKEVL